MLSLFLINPIVAHSEWKQDSTGWWYTEGTTYATGWRNIGGNWYYFYSDGYMAHDCWIDNCYLNNQGVWTTDLPQTNTTNTSVNTGNVATKGDMVYVSSKGIYHNTPDAHGMKNSTEMTREEAEAAGYRACEAKHCP